MKNYRYAAALAALALGLAGCGGGNNGNGYFPGSYGGGGYGPTSACDPGTDVTLVRPAPGTYAGQNVNSVTIVANGNNNALGQETSQFSLVLSDGPSFGAGSPYDSFASNPLTPASGSGLPQPYPSDYYYQASLPQPLISGQTWYVFVVNTAAGCTTGPEAGTFGT